MNQEWLKINAAAEYMGLSPRKIRSLLKSGLRHSRLESGIILIKRAWCDEYLESREFTTRDEAQRFVTDVLEEARR